MVTSHVYTGRFFCILFRVRVILKGPTGVLHWGLLFIETKSFSYSKITHILSTIKYLLPAKFLSTFVFIVTIPPFLLQATSNIALPYGRQGNKAYKCCLKLYIADNKGHK